MGEGRFLQSPETADAMRTGDAPGANDRCNEPGQYDGGQLIFVGGAPRSGTTLVQNMLDSHPQIFGGPEFLHIPEIIELRDRLHHSVSRRLIDRICSHEEVDNHIRTLIEGFLMPLGTEDGIRLISEKTPGNVLAFGGLAELWPRARLVHVVRDPRAIISSMLEVGARAARLGYGVQKFTRDTQAAINHVQSCFEAGFEAARRTPDRVLTIVYEALVHNPESGTQRLCEFLDSEWRPDMITPAAHKHSAEGSMTAPTNEIWYDANMYNRNPDLKSVDKWRTRLTPAQQVAICKAFQRNEDLARLGYDVSLASLGAGVRMAGSVADVLGRGLRRGARLAQRGLRRLSRPVPQIG